MKTLNSDIEKLVDELHRTDIKHPQDAGNYLHWKARYPLNADAVETATATLHFLDEIASTETYPWKMPEIDPTWNGNISLIWHHGSRMLVIHCTPDTTEFYTADPNGIIHPIAALGVLQLKRLWAWFWDDAATWVYNKPFS